VTFFAGTAVEMRRCPRRMVIDHPEVIPIMHLRRDLGGRLGVADKRQLSSQAVAGLREVEAAVAWAEAKREGGGS
jgi:hypothetical protein